MKERLVRWLTSLSAKYVVVFVLLVGVSIVTTGAVQAYFSYQDSKRSLFRLQREKAMALASEVHDFFAREARALKTVGPGQLIPKKQLVEQLGAVVKTAPAVSAYYLDGRGRSRQLGVRLSREAWEMWCSLRVSADRHPQKLLRTRHE